MITNSGKSVINKYLLGQAPAYASYIAIGCGPKPLSSIESYGDYSEKTSLDFEMFRIPISSRGIVSENGVEKIVLTGELPTEERYEISEIGVFSAGSNSIAGNLDSKNIFTFSANENWQYHTISTSSSIPSVSASLDSPANNNIINVLDSNSNPISVFQTNNDNPIFFKQNRSERYERCRFLNNVILMAGDTSNLQTFNAQIFSAVGNGYYILYTLVSGGSNFSVGDIISISGCSNSSFNLSNVTIVEKPSENVIKVFSSVNDTLNISSGTVSLLNFSVSSSTSHIHLSGISTDFSKNSPTDELRVAFSIINKDGSSTNSPDYARISMIFSETEQSTEFAKLDIDVINGTDPGEYDLENNRYISIARKLENVYTTANFSWSLVKIVRIYVSTLNNISGTLTPTPDYYIGLDSVRFENVSAQNPLYGLVGYTIIKNTNAETIIKQPNTNNYVEFRFVVGTA